MSVRSVSVRLQAQVANYVSGIRQAKQVTSDFRSELADAASKGNVDLNRVANGAIAMGAAMVAAVGAVVATGARFEHSMAQVQAVSGATADEFESMRQAAIDMGSSTVFSASEAANATEELAKAGLSAAEITGGALAGALNLAAAGGIGLAESASIAAGTMRAFGLAAHDVNRIADVLASGANRANTTVSELGQGLSNVGVVASQVGLSIEDTTAVLAAFADNNVRGADAGTQLKTTLLRLLAPTDQAKERMDDLGISAFNADGSTRSLVEIVKSLETGLAGMTDQQRSATLSLLFGQRAIIGSNILLKEGSEGIAEYVAMVSEMGVAADTAGDRLDSLQGDVQLLKSALEGLAIESSGGATGGLRFLAQFLTQIISQVSALPAPVLSSVTAFVGLAGVALLAGGAILKLQVKLAALNAQLAATGPAGAKAAAGLGAFMRLAGQAAAVFILFQAVNALAEGMRPAAADAKLLADALVELTDTGKVTGEAARVFGADLHRVGQGVRLMGDDSFDAMVKLEQSAGILADIGRRLSNVLPGGEDVNLRWSELAENVNELETALIHLVSQGHLQDVKQILQEIWASDPAVSLTDLEDAMPGLTEVMRAAQKDFNELSLRVQDVDNDLEGLAERFGLTGDDAVEAINEMLAAWSDSARKFVSLSDAYKDALGEVGDAAELTTETFIDQLRQQVEAQEQWAANMEKLAARVPETMLDELARLGPEGAELVALMASMQDKELAEVIALWERAGIATGDGIADGILAGTEKAQGTVEELADQINSLPPTTDVRVNVQTHYTESGVRPGGGGGGGRFNRWGGVYTNRDGGVYTAQSGLLRKARIFPPVAPARFAFAEPATGGEAFIPRLGDRQRSLGILSEAAAWYGAQVVGGDGARQAQQLGAAQQWQTAASPVVEVTVDPAGNGSTTYNVYPERATFTVRDLETLQRRQDVLSRVGRLG